MSLFVSLVIGSGVTYLSLQYNPVDVISGSVSLSALVLYLELGAILLAVTLNGLLASVLAYKTKAVPYAMFALIINSLPYVLAVLVLAGLLLSNLSGKMHDLIYPDLAASIKSGDINKVKKAIERGDGEIWREFSDAIYYGDLEIIKLLMSHGEKVDEHDLSDAIKYGELAVVKYFSSLGIKFRKNAAHLAATNGDLKMLKFLVSKGVNINAPDRDDMLGVLPIHSAASSEYAKSDVFQFLLDNGASVDTTTGDGDTSLMLRAHCLPYSRYFEDRQTIPGKIQVISFLLKNGANINAQNHKSETALHYSLFVHDCDTARFLIEQNADSSLLSEGKKKQLGQDCKIKFQ